MSWIDLNKEERRRIIREGISKGYTDTFQIRNDYNKYGEGGLLNKFSNGGMVYPTYNNKYYNNSYAHSDYLYRPSLERRDRLGDAVINNGRAYKYEDVEDVIKGGYYPDLNHYPDGGDLTVANNINPIDRPSGITPITNVPVVGLASVPSSQNMVVDYNYNPFSSTVTAIGNYNKTNISPEYQEAFDKKNKRRKLRLDTWDGRSEENFIIPVDIDEKMENIINKFEWFGGTEGIKQQRNGFKGATCKTGYCAQGVRTFESAYNIKPTINLQKGLRDYIVKCYNEGRTIATINSKLGDKEDKYFNRALNNISVDDVDYIDKVESAMNSAANNKVDGAIKSTEDIKREVYEEYRNGKIKDKNFNKELLSRLVSNGSRYKPVNREIMDDILATRHPDKRGRYTEDDILEAYSIAQMPDYKHYLSGEWRRPGSDSEHSDAWNITDAQEKAGDGNYMYLYSDGLYGERKTRKDFGPPGKKGDYAFFNYLKKIERQNSNLILGMENYLQRGDRVLMSSKNSNSYQKLGDGKPQSTHIGIVGGIDEDTGDILIFHVTDDGTISRKGETLSSIINGEKRVITGLFKQSYNENYEPVSYHDSYQGIQQVNPNEITQGIMPRNSIQ